MRTAHNYQGFKKVVVHNPVTDCVVCRQPVSFAYRAQRHLVFLNGEAQHLFYDVKRCDDSRCPPYYPEVVRVHALPYHQYSLPVIARIGALRLKQTQTFTQIGGQLREQHKIQISDREVEYLFGVYLALVSTPIEKDAKRLEALRLQGRIVLSIDAAQPELDGEALWVFRDQLSGEVLRAKSCSGMDASGIAQEIQEIRALKVPIVGVISDAQNIILKAVEQVLPGVPHQLCQIHYLKDLAKSVNQADRDLMHELGLKLKGLRSFERAAEVKTAAEALEKQIKGPPTIARETSGSDAPRPGRPATRAVLERPVDEAEAKLVRDLCELIRAILKTPGHYPLEAPGVETSRKLHELLKMLEEELPKKRDSVWSGSCGSI